MKRPFKIGLVYINTNNIGDIVIFDTTKYLVKKSLKLLGVDDYEIVPIDMGERLAGKSEMPNSFPKVQAKKYARSNKFVKEWKTSKLYHYLLKNELPKIDRMDLIIFAGGGLIKFHEQFFHMYIDEITSLAEKKHIPVMFNAVGIEGYKQSDERCQILKNAINRKCVKAVSTRDDLTLLQDKYLVSKKAELVCDPALWAKETYKVSENKRETIGLGVIRPEIFSLYGVDTPKDTLIELYSAIILELEKQGTRYKLFTNGGRRDHKFIEDIRTFMGRDEAFSKNIEPIPKSGKELTLMINSYSRILTCRMHAAVIAYALGVPAVSLVWNKKQKYFAELTKQPSNLIFDGDFKNPHLVANKILRSTMPDFDESYKNSDFNFIYNQIKIRYNKRFIDRAMRRTRAVKHQILQKYSSK